jgi:hypothetical protein
MLSDKDVQHVSLSCLESRNWRTKFLNEKCLNGNKGIAYRKVFGAVKE